MKNGFCKITAMVLAVLMMSGAFAAFGEDIQDAEPVIAEQVEEAVVIDEEPVDAGLADAEATVVESKTEEVSAINVTKNATVKLLIGDVRQITVAEGKEIKSCTSSKKSVATVTTDGLITVKGEGTAKITVKLTNKKSYTLTVKASWPAATGITLTVNGETDLYTGNTLQLTATIEPDGANPKVTWSSSKKSVATVSSKGLVKAKGKGTCTITAKTAGGIEATVQITVAKPTTYSKKELCSYIGNKYTLIASIFGGTASNGAYKSKDGKIKAEYYTDNGLVNKIELSSTGHTLYTISVGNTLATAEKLAAKYGFAEDTTHDFGYDVTMTKYGRYLGMNIKSGKVTKIGVGYYTDDEGDLYY